MLELKMEIWMANPDDVYIKESRLSALFSAVIFSYKDIDRSIAHLYDLLTARHVCCCCWWSSFDDEQKLFLEKRFCFGFVFVHWHTFKFDKLSTLSTSSFPYTASYMVILSISSVVCCELNFHSRVHTSALYYIPLWVYVQWSGKHETTTSKNRNNNTNIFTQANQKFLIHPVFLLHISIIFSLTLFRGIFYFVFYLIFFPAERAQEFLTAYAGLNSTRL
jgi:hypothetical protein